MSKKIRDIVSKKTKWECDGCGKIISSRESELKVCGCKNHWGWMEVGGPAHDNYHSHGIHPMSAFKDSLMTHPEVQKIQTETKKKKMN